ncbi:hypothetical protein [Robertmurraya kyonggiensis]|uniref:Uncharacterized protein n=1 Tax=Robertmurraya kyonggiensis TaxID=1037680 RepID=A0A4U1D805_9BACI|nr:hypothetical protein [Robertmurraya kyonggiensis]TKC18113.1 hypothetical protein FA727_00715 [Robertmurraya kyonggiensis]
MKKAKKWVGILALAFLIVQSTVGIINYTQTGGQQNFQGRMERMNGGGMPPQMNQEGTTGDTSGTVANTEQPQFPQNGEMTNLNGNFERLSGSTSFLRNLENGVVGVILDGLSLLLVVAWIVLSVLMRKHDKTPEV